MWCILSDIVLVGGGGVSAAVIVAVVISRTPMQSSVEVEVRRRPDTSKSWGARVPCAVCRVFFFWCGFVYVCMCVLVKCWVLCCVSVWV